MVNSEADLSCWFVSVLLYGVQPMKTRISQLICAVKLPIINLSVTSSNLSNIHIKYILCREQVNGGWGTSSMNLCSSYMGYSTVPHIFLINNIKGRFLRFRMYHNLADLFSKLSESTFNKEISKFQ